MSDLDRNLALDLVRVTESAALAAARWMGRGEKEKADGAAVDAMRRLLDTVMIDGLDQMTRAGRFLTLDWFPAYSKSLIETDEKIIGRVLAYHRGYRRLGIRHERVATVFTNERWEFKDNLIFKAPGEHVFRLHWLLLDGEWEPEKRKFGFGIRLKTPLGWVTLLITPDLRLSNKDFKLTVIRAGELIYGKGRPLPFEGSD